MSRIVIDPAWVAQQVLAQLNKSQQDAEAPVRVYWPGEDDPTEDNVWARVLDIAIEPTTRVQGGSEPDCGASVTVLVAIALSDVALSPGSPAGSVLAPWQAARVIGWLLDGYAVNESSDGQTGHRLAMGRAVYPQVGQVDEADPTKWALAVMARGTVDRVSGTEPISLK